MTELETNKDRLKVSKVSGSMKIPGREAAKNIRSVQGTVAPDSIGDFSLSVELVDQSGAFLKAIIDARNVDIALRKK